MIRFLRELRLIPVVLFATSCLAALKFLGLLLDGGYILNDPDLSEVDRPIHVDRDLSTGGATVVDNKILLPQAGSSWAQQVFGYPEITGTLPAEKQAEKNIERIGSAPPAKPQKQPDGRVVGLDDKPAPSPSERAILERLQERRQQLDSRNREIELRESLLQAAEKKFENRAGELRDLESSAGGALQRKEEADAQRLRNLVTMYENMKAKDAARIFDRLEMRILVEVASQMNPRRMSDILGSMSPEAAERLTVELANRATAGGDRGADIGNLPKIEGTPRN
jgi:flagellar motility protein MotE (MotC chaperone)